MRIQLLSDLHPSPIRISRPAPGADLLVLAGDIGSYQDRSRLMETDFGLGRFSPARAGPRRWSTCPATTSTTT